MTGSQKLTSLPRRHLTVAVASASFALAMLGMAYAAVPLYRIFCQVTGFGGTTQRAATPSETVLERVVTVRFDANVASGLGWKFEPVHRTMKVHVGENALAFYRATNTGSVPVTGTASFNVAPESVGSYFVKVACFCFTEQTLQPGESVEMPVSFYVDPEFVNDKDTRRLSEITLSYTFFPVDKPSTSEARAAVGMPPGQVETGGRPRG